MEHLPKVPDVGGSKIIHYCWFGGKPLSKLAKKCLNSWKKYLPDYEIMLWNEQNFDVNINRFCAEAYKEKKWAFVADVARCWALREYGGLYFDTDMLVLENIDHILNCDFAAGWESDYNVAAGIIWTSGPHHPVIDALWQYYETHEFDLGNVYAFSIPTLLTGILQRDHGLKYFVPGVQHLTSGVSIYPREYFYPIGSDGSRTGWTDNTCMVHYYLGSWLSRSDRLRAEFKFRFGDKLGMFLLRILVIGKHILKSILKVPLYPFRKIKQTRDWKAFDDKWIAEFDKDAAKLKNPPYIALYNKNWFGTSIATKELFDHPLGIEELHSDILLEYVAQYLVRSGAKLIIFSAFAYGWNRLIKRIKELDEGITVKVLWHGSLALNVEYYDWQMFHEILTMTHTGLIDSIGCVKKSLYEFLRRKGLPAEFVANRVSLPKETVQRLRGGKPHERTRIGLYASGDRWVKNYYNQLAAASLFEDAEVDCIPLTDKTVILSKLFGILLSGSYTNLKREKLFESLASNDINLYATFTECAPMLPLESLELGVPCITGNNHHYWQGTPLEEYLVVNRVDDCIEIFEKAQYCLEHKDEVLRLYEEWKKDYFAESIRTVEEFLRV